MTPQEHYAEAERLIAEGEKVVEKIRNAPREYRAAVAPGPNQSEWVRNRRNDLGKQAMGIWAQAQVHATLGAGSYVVVLGDG
jgi:hypothetical protein